MQQKDATLLLVAFFACFFPDLHAVLIECRAVEVAPIYDNPGETTVLAAAEIVHSLLTLMVHEPVQAEK